MDNVAISVDSVAKCFPMYGSPRSRLKQIILPRIQKAAGLVQSTYFTEFWALQDISFSICKGESVGLIGRNGSGKSTLLQLIAGTLTPTRGNLEVAGRVSALLELGSGFSPEFTGLENVYLNAAILGLSHGEIQDSLDDILSFADIGAFIDQPLKTYSSGMVMRLAFSVAVSVSPDILIVDEALAVGDAAFQYKCLSRIQKLIDSGLTFLFVSHDLATVRAFCSRAIYLSKGRLLCDGTTFEAGEAYLQELRAAQRIADGSNPHAEIRAKAPINAPTGSAFGNHFGDIQSVRFRHDSSHHVMLRFADNLCVDIRLEYGPEIQFPTVAMAITDSRHVNICGLYSEPLRVAQITGDLQIVEVSFEFEVRLGPGKYFITVVLEDRESASNSLLVDKQGAVLSFEMEAAPGSRLIGVCDMNIKVHESYPI